MGMIALLVFPLLLWLLVNSGKIDQWSPLKGRIIGLSLLALALLIQYFWIATVIEGWQLSISPQFENGMFQPLVLFINWLLQAGEKTGWLVVGITAIIVLARVWHIRAINPWLLQAALWVSTFALVGSVWDAFSPVPLSLYAFPSNEPKGVFALIQAQRVVVSLLLVGALYWVLMKSKAKFWQQIMLLVLVGIITIGCNDAQSEPKGVFESSEPSAPITTAAPTNAETTVIENAAQPVEGAMQSSTFKEGTESSFALTGPEISFDSLSLTLPGDIASKATGKRLPRIVEVNICPCERTPAHIEVNLDDYVLQARFYQPHIYLYPAAEYAELDGSVSIPLLQKLLTEPDQPSNLDTLPLLPFANAMPLFAANIKPISFQKGKGVRWLTQYAQYKAIANNQDLFYHFQGLSDDGNYYIIAILPVTSVNLAEHGQLDATGFASALVPADGVPHPVSYDAEEPWHQYYEEITNLLDHTPPKQFYPKLEQLDQLIASIRLTDAVLP